jgi:hypothetical protein
MWRWDSSVSVMGVLQTMAAEVWPGHEADYLLTSLTVALSVIFSDSDTVFSRKYEILLIYSSVQTPLQHQIS